VFSVFRKWKAETENQSGEKVKSLKSDNGGEYDSREFKSFCVGIRMIKTVAGTTEWRCRKQDGSMRLHSGLPKAFWAEAISTAAYLINRGPSVPLEYRIPEEVWTGREVSYAHLKVFGCVAYVRVQEEARDKLDPRARKCYLIGYGSDQYGYRFWDNQKIIRERDVTFDESMLYKHVVTSDRKGKTPQTSEVELEDIMEDDVAGINLELPEVPQQPQEPSVPVRRSTRVRRPPERLVPTFDHILMTDGGEPEHYSEAVQTKDSEQWELAMRDERNSLMQNKTWRLPEGKKALQNKWVFRIQDDPDGSRRYKARLVVKGFQQLSGIYYTEVFSPVVKMTTVRVVLGIVAAEDLHLEQLDVRTAFLHGELEEDIFMEQPEGFQVIGKENLVCKLEKSLYGLKQAPRQWYKKFDSFMIANGFRRCEADSCCYMKDFGDCYIILLLYVDDMLLAGSSTARIEDLKRQMSKEFDMKDLGEAKQILGMRIIRDRSAGTLMLTQERYIEKVLERFNHSSAKPTETPLGNHFKLTKEQVPKT
jgi:hypothetical protein